MTIGKKLLSIILIIIVSFIISIGAYFVILAPVRKIEEEKYILEDLRASMYNMELQLLRLTSSRFVETFGKFIEAKEQNTAAFARLPELTVLPEASSAIQESVIIIERLYQLLEKNAEAIIRAAEELVEDAEIVYKVTNNFTLRTFHTSEYGKQNSHYPMAIVHVNSFYNTVEILDNSITTSLNVLGKQFALIDDEIAKLNQKANITTISVIAALLLLSSLLGLFGARAIAKSIQSIDRDIGILQTGDLSHAFTVTSRDEIGRLAGRLNTFLETLRNTMLSIQRTSSTNVEVKEDLVATSTETAASTTEINANAESIRGQIDNLDKSIADSTRAGDTISNSIERLNGQVREQMSMVEESTAAITEMISSIENVSRIMEGNKEITDNLVSTAENGGNMLKNTTRTIGEINESVESIRGMAGMIQRIASQTNLLAMNAAIEAAHAGEYGKGFAVVADEIRKLAEASSDNSKEITTILKTVVDRIGAATDSGRDTSRAFDEIDTEVHNVSRSLDEISFSMGELKQGGDRILKAMAALQDVSVKVQNGSVEMREGSAQVKQAINVVRRVSSEVSGSIQEISTGLKEISYAVNGLTELSEKIGSVSDELDGQVNKFKT